MNTDRLTGKKIREWLRRYLPCEIAGTTCEMGGAALTYHVTDSAAAAAIVATIGASVGFYAAAFIAAVRTAYRMDRSVSRSSRALRATYRALRSVAIEFGPAEVIDSLLIRPLAFYFGPMLFGGLATGWIFAKLVADVGFYALTIFSYERFNALLVVRRNAGEVRHEPSAAVAAA